MTLWGATGAAGAALAAPGCNMLARKIGSRAARRNNREEQDMANLE
jgi:hypothetical protein